MASSKRIKKRPLSLSLSQSAAREPRRTRLEGKKSNISHLCSDASKDEDNCSTSELFVESENNPKRRLVEEWLQKNRCDPDAFLDGSSQETLIRVSSPVNIDEVDCVESTGFAGTSGVAGRKTHVESTRHTNTVNPSEGISHTKLINPSEGTSHTKIINPSEGTSHTNIINPSEGTSHTNIIDLSEGTSHTKTTNPLEGTNKTDNIDHAESMKHPASTSLADKKAPDQSDSKESDASSPSPSPLKNEDNEPLLQCPVCWKKFEKTQGQTAHLKACGAANGLTTTQLINAINLHKKQLAERKRLGLPSAVVPPASAKKAPTKKGRPPKDSNLQLALALSLSLAQEGQQREERQEALTTFGFTAKPSGTKKSAPVLLTRTQAERERLITEKVAIVLMDDAGGSQRSACSADNLPTVQSTQLREWYNEDHPLWKKSCSSPSQTNSSTYYVSALGVVIAPSSVEPGAKLRHLSQVPGRINTPKKAPRKSEEKLSPVGSSVSVCRTPTNAVSLSKLEQEIKAKHFSDWASMLKNSTMSDVTIYVRGGLGIRAHKLVFAVRCRDVLDDVTQQRDPVTDLIVDVILWPEISNNVAVCFLEYLYYGSIRSIHTLGSDISELQWLANQYEATDLLNSLEYLENKKRLKRSSETSQPVRRRHLSDAVSENNEPAPEPSPEKLFVTEEDQRKLICSPSKTPSGIGKETCQPVLELHSPQRMNEGARSPELFIHSQNSTCKTELIPSPDPFADECAPPSPTSEHEDNFPMLTSIKKSPSDICSILTLKRRTSIDSWTKTISDDGEVSERKQTPVATSPDQVNESAVSVKLSSGSGGISFSGRKSSVASSTKAADSSNMSPLMGRLSTNTSLIAGSETGQASNQFELRLSSGSSHDERIPAETSGNKDSPDVLNISFSSANLPRFYSGSAQQTNPQLSDDDDIIIVSDDEPAVFTQKEPTATTGDGSRPTDLETPASSKSGEGAPSDEKESPYISPIWNGFEDVQYCTDTNQDWNSDSNKEISRKHEDKEPPKIHDLSSSSENSLHGSNEDRDVCKMLDDSMNAVLASSILERALSESDTPNPSPKPISPEQVSPDSGRVTPMKDYSGMTSPEIKTELQKFGLKRALGRRKGILMLEHIYDELHPWVPVGKKDSLIKETEVIPESSQPALLSPIPSLQVDSCSSSSSRAEGFSDAESAESDSAVIVSQPALRKLNLDDLRGVVKNHIEGNPALHRKVLEYKPIFIEDLHSELKTCGYKVKISDLMAYLGEKLQLMDLTNGKQGFLHVKKPRVVKTLAEDELMISSCSL